MIWSSPSGVAPPVIGANRSGESSLWNSGTTRERRGVQGIQVIGREGGT